jgi:hypothetical protein
MSHLRRVFSLSIALAVVLGVNPLMPAVSAEAECSSEQRAQLRKKGFTSKEIREFCEKSESDSDDDDDWDRNQRGGGRRGDVDRGAGMSASVCQTPWGACRLGVAMPVGATCVCYMPNGQFPGTAR